MRTKHITKISSTKFLGLIIDKTLLWKNHIDQIMSKLRSACYAIKTVNVTMSQEILRMTYFFYVHSIITYNILR